MYTDRVGAEPAVYPLYTQGRMLLELGMSPLAHLHQHTIFYSSNPFDCGARVLDVRADAGVGVLPGYDLTHEAAFAKLLWLVSRKDLTFSQRQRIFQAPVCGEMTVDNGPGGLVPRAE